jgi:predicted DNA-binding transcriptional regulator AlpA
MSSDNLHTPANDNQSGGELLLGAEAIATCLGITRRQAYRLTADALIPSFKVGGTVAARRSSLKRWLDEKESARPAA